MTRKDSHAGPAHHQAHLTAAAFSPAGLPPRQVLVIGFDERNVQIGLLVGNQGNIGGNGRSLQGMGRDQVALRRLQRLLAIKKI